jgi:hypothetical protein
LNFRLSHATIPPDGIDDLKAYNGSEISPTIPPPFGKVKVLSRHGIIIQLVDFTILNISREDEIWQWIPAFAGITEGKEAAFILNMRQLWADSVAMFPQI